MKKFNKLKCLITIAITTVLMVQNVLAIDEKVNVKLNGNVVIFPDAQPFIDENSRTLVPIRFVAEAMGTDVKWEENGKVETVTLRKGNRIIELKIGDYGATVNGSRWLLDTAAILKEDRTFVPLRFISEIMGAMIGWDESTNTVSITDSTISYTPAPVATPVPVTTPIFTPIPAKTPVLLKIDLNEDPIFQEFAAIDGFTSASGQDAPFYKFIYSEVNPYNNKNLNAVFSFDYNKADTGKKDTKKTNFYVNKYDDKNMERFKKALGLIIPDAQKELYDLSVQYFGGKTEKYSGFICEGKYEIYIRPYNNPQYPIELQGAYISVLNGGQ